MDVTGINGAIPQQGADAGVLQARRAQMLGPVATLFKESTDQLESELKTSGVSLATLAEQKGVSKPDLVDAIKQSLQQKFEGDGATLSDSQRTNMANRIVNHKHGGHHHHHSDSTGAQL
jgi:hypothetical protein